MAIEHKEIKMIQGILHICTGPDYYKKADDLTDDHIINLMRKWNERLIGLETLSETCNAPQIVAMRLQLEKAIEKCDKHLIKREANS